jgi:hypothetical protein
MKIVSKELLLKKSCCKGLRASPSGKRTIFNHYLQRIVYKYHLESVSVEGVVAGSSGPSVARRPRARRPPPWRTARTPAPPYTAPPRSLVGSSRKGRPSSQYRRLRTRLKVSPALRFSPTTISTV